MSDQQSSEINEPASSDKKVKRRLRFWAIVVFCLATLGSGGVYAWNWMFAMPGESYQVPANAPQVENIEDQGPPAADKPAESLAESLKATVNWLAVEIGERNLAHYRSLCRAADGIEARLDKLPYQVERQSFQFNGLDCFNIVAERTGTEQPSKILIVGAHYDSARGTPGANDNGSGIAALLALAQHFSDKPTRLTLRFVAFTNEEPPYFQTEDEMGSWVYAKRCRLANEDLVGVISLETMGYFSDEPDSQNYPAPLSALYPSTGNFIGFVSNLGSRPLLTQALKRFREKAKIPSEGACLPSSLQGIGWSDHWSFWQEGYQGIMVTDTAPFRYPHYHRKSDTPEKLDYEKLAKVVNGLAAVIESLANTPE